MVDLLALDVARRNFDWDALRSQNRNVSGCAHTSGACDSSYPRSETSVPSRSVLWWDCADTGVGGGPEEE